MTTTSLPAIVCTPWCSNGSGHTDATHPDDQACMSRRQSVELTAMPLLTLRDGQVEGRDTIGAYLIREGEGARTLLQLVHGDEDVVPLTLDEAGKLRDLLDRHIARCTPLSDDGLKVFEIMAEASGHPVQQAAESLGIDLATATSADGRRLAWYYGTRQGDKGSAGQR